MIEQGDSSINSYNNASRDASSPNDTAIVIGASGGIGQAVATAFAERIDIARVVACSRHGGQLNFESNKIEVVHYQADEAGIDEACQTLKTLAPQPRYIVIASGVLHDSSCDLMPEKRLSQLNHASLETVFHTNTFLPLLWLKSLTTILDRKSPCTVATLSARVGSISDNQLGGWYSYRASKAALNMLLKTAAIEFKLRYPHTKLLAFHPGTTDTVLSKPFQANVPEGKLFTPQFVAQQLLNIMQQAKPNGRLDFIDWDNKSIEW